MRCSRRLPPPDGAGLVRTMVERIGHRGPDASGVADLLPTAPVQLGHRRLSIIDLSAAADQPFVSDGLHLSYNGELYNYRELRDELRGRGVRFRTESDTEVVLECWRRWGTDGLRRLRGMFAFALYDERDGALTLVRDPLGIKPLYVMPRGAGLLFASELKALVTAVGPRAHASTRRAWWRRRCSTSCPSSSRPFGRSSSCRAGRGRSGGPTARARSGRYWEPAEEAVAAAGGPTG